jgi:hypothetical protein
MQKENYYILKKKFQISILLHVHDSYSSHFPHQKGNKRPLSLTAPHIVGIE